jgi:DNA repair exonuclease SbcCD ATPase subunit
MNNVIVNEQQLQIEVDKLKTEFAETKDIYREVCVLLFFRYGITPTANKLYQYVRRGSMSAPADALNKFWSELRDKSRVRIERTDIPEKISKSAGNFIAALWNEAQEAAQAGFSELIENATSEILQFKLQTESAKENTAQTELLLAESQARLENVLKRVSETDYLLSVNTQTLTEQENAFKTLKIEYEALTRVLIETKSSFSQDLETYSASLLKAEERYVILEKNALLEVDRSRQQALKLGKELQAIHKANTSERASYIKDLVQHQKQISTLQEKLGVISGRYSEASKQLRNTTNKLNKLQRTKIATS